MRGYKEEARNRSSGAISRVLYPWAVTHPTGVCHLSGMVVTYHLVRSTLRLGRATLVASVYMTLQPIGCTAACIATHSGELLPHLFTITAGERVLRGCHSLLHLPTLADSFPLGSMALCVARTFLTRPSAQDQRGARQTAPLLYSVFFYFCSSTRWVGACSALRRSICSTTLRASVRK